MQKTNRITGYYRATLFGCALTQVIVYWDGENWFSHGCEWARPESDFAHIDSHPISLSGVEAKPPGQPACRYEACPAHGVHSEPSVPDRCSQGVCSATTGEASGYAMGLSMVAPGDF